MTRSLATAAEDMDMGDVNPAVLKEVKREVSQVRDQAGYTIAEVSQSRERLPTTDWC